MSKGLRMSKMIKHSGVKYIMLKKENMISEHKMTQFRFVCIVLKNNPMKNTNKITLIPVFTRIKTENDKLVI